jgi:saccharopine dehydrogenase (NAD+, L-lysine forming)
VGTAFARTAARRDAFEHLIVADHLLGRAQRAAQSASDRFNAVALDASDETAVGDLLRAHRCDVLVNARDPTLTTIEEKLVFVAL